MLTDDTGAFNRTEFMRDAYLSTSCVFDEPFYALGPSTLSTAKPMAQRVVANGMGGFDALEKSKQFPFFSAVAADPL